jgi:hypothetical protein
LDIFLDCTVLGWTGLEFYSQRKLALDTINMTIGILFG